MSGSCRGEQPHRAHSTHPPMGPFRSARWGAPVATPPALDRRNPLAKDSEGALQSLVDRSALIRTERAWVGPLPGFKGPLVSSQRVFSVLMSGVDPYICCMAIAHDHSCSSMRCKLT